MSKATAKPTKEPQRAIPSGSTAAKEFYDALASLLADQVVRDVRDGKKRKVRPAWADE